MNSAYSGLRIVLWVGEIVRGYLSRVMIYRLWYILIFFDSSGLLKKEDILEVIATREIPQLGGD